MSDINELLEKTEGLTEEFKAQVTPLFEEAVKSAVEAKTSELTEQFKAEVKTLAEQVEALESEKAKLVEEHKEALESIQEHVEDLAEEKVREEMDTLSEQLDRYFDYLGEEYVRENEQKIVSAHKVDMAESFMEGMKSLFEMYNVETPEAVTMYEKRIDEITKERDESYRSLQEQIDRNQELEAQLLDAEKISICESAIADFTETDKARFKKLASNIDTNDLDAFKSQVQTIVESLDVKSQDSLTETIVTPSVIDIEKGEEKTIVEDKTVEGTSLFAADPNVQALAEALKKMK